MSNNQFPHMELIPDGCRKNRKDIMIAYLHHNMGRILMRDLYRIEWYKNLRSKDRGYATCELCASHLTPDGSEVNHVFIIDRHLDDESAIVQHGIEQSIERLFEHVNTMAEFAFEHFKDDDNIRIYFVTCNKSWVPIISGKDLKVLCFNESDVFPTATQENEGK